MTPDFKLSLKYFKNNFTLDVLSIFSIEPYSSYVPSIINEICEARDVK